MNDPRLDSFAELVIERMDAAVEAVHVATSQHSPAPGGYAEVQKRLSMLDQQTLELIQQCVRMAVTDAVHGVLFTVSEMADNEEWSVLVDGAPLSDLTPGLHHELVNEHGWITRFSKHDRPTA